MFPKIINITQYNLLFYNKIINLNVEIQDRTRVGLQIIHHNYNIMLFNVKFMRQTLKKLVVFFIDK
jgi:hypothetical protein